MNAKKLVAEMNAVLPREGVMARNVGSFESEARRNLVQAKFTWEAENAPVFHGFYEPVERYSHSGGWELPWFTQHVCGEITDLVESEGYWEVEREFRPQDGIDVFRVRSLLPEVEPHEFVEFAACTFQWEGNPLKLYPFAHDIWTWKEVR